MLLQEDISLAMPVYYKFQNGGIKPAVFALVRRVPTNIKTKRQPEFSDCLIFFLRPRRAGVTFPGVEK
jgi:hypothetical protein